MFVLRGICLLVLCGIRYVVSPCGVSVAQAATPIVIQDTVDEYIFNTHDIDVLEDANGKYTLADIRSDGLAAQFVPNTNYSPRNSHVQSYYWLRISIHGNASSQKHWVLEFFDQSIDWLEAYIPQPDGTYRLYRAGDQHPFQQRRFRHKNFEFDISPASPIAQYYFFRLKSSTPGHIFVVLRSMDRFIYYALNEYFLYGMFYGMILIIALYNLLMFGALREKQYWVYVIYVLCVGIYSMCTEGISFQYLWPDHPEWNNTSIGISLFLVILSALLFTKLFLHTRSRFPRLDLLINCVIVLRSGIFLVALLLYPSLFTYQWIECIPLSVAFYTGIHCYLKGYKPARFFVVAYGLLFIGFWVKVLISLDPPLIDGSVVTHYSVSIGFWLEMWLLMFAMGDKVRIIKSSKDRAMRRIIKEHETNQQLKDKVNRELEAEVAKRTDEINRQKHVIEQQCEALEEANALLTTQAAEIRKINSLLDLDNFRLKQNIQEERLARAGSQHMSYEEFRTLFPNDLACFRYLEEKKWTHGYQCHKCSGTKFTVTPGKFGRRCSRCGHVESPTAYTIFHGLKFPIEKAFYIVHLLISGRNDLTIDQLSEMLELRRNTCWNFKDKTHKIVQHYRRNKEKNVCWEQVIFHTD